MAIINSGSGIIFLDADPNSAPAIVPNVGEDSEIAWMPSTKTMYNWNRTTTTWDVTISAGGPGSVGVSDGTTALTITLANPLLLNDSNDFNFVTSGTQDLTGSLILDPNVANIMSSSPTGVLANIVTGDSVTGTGVTGSGLEVGLDGVTAGNSLSVTVGQGLYSPDEVIESAVALVGAAPNGAQFGINTTTGDRYYVSAGNWTLAPSGGSFSVTDGTTTEAINAGDTLTLTGTDSINLVVTATDAITANVNLDGATGGNALSSTVGQGLYSPDEVLEAAGAFAGVAPNGAQFGIDTSSGNIYYVNGAGNWTLVPAPVPAALSFDITDGTTTETIGSGNTITLATGNNNTAVVTATDTITIDTVIDPAATNIISSSAAGLLAGITIGDGISGTGTAASPLEINIDGTTAGNALIETVGQGLYVADSVITNAGALAGAAPAGAEFGIDTTTGDRYYVSAGNWVAAPTGASTVDPIATNVMTSSASGLLVDIKNGDGLSGEGTTASPLEINIDGVTAGNALVETVGQGLYVPDSVIESAVALAGVAPVGAEWGIDTVTGQTYHVAGGNWTATPVAAGDNIYTADGTLTGQRDLHGDVNKLTFDFLDGATKTSSTGWSNDSIYSIVTDTAGAESMVAIGSDLIESVYTSPLGNTSSINQSLGKNMFNLTNQATGDYAFYSLGGIDTIPTLNMTVNSGATNTSINLGPLDITLSGGIIYTGGVNIFIGNTEPALSQVSVQNQYRVNLSAFGNSTLAGINATIADIGRTLVLVNISGGTIKLLHNDAGAPADAGFALSNYGDLSIRKGGSATVMYGSSPIGVGRSWICTGFAG